jgi:hypothetical protein
MSTNAAHGPNATSRKEPDRIVTAGGHHSGHGVAAGLSHGGLAHSGM